MLPERLLSLLARITVEKRDAEEIIAPPATPQALLHLTRYAAELGTQISPEYLRFLGHINGLTFNGIMLYGALPECSGTVFDLVQMNHLFSGKGPGQREYLLYGESGDELFAYDLVGNTWDVLDRASLSRLETFEHCDDWLCHILQFSLEI